MDDVLIFADTERSPELRRELPVGVTDPFLYAEAGGTQHVVISQVEISRLAAADTGAVLHPLEEFGSYELVRQGLGRDEVLEQVAVRFCRDQGIARAVVIDVVPLQSMFRGRRRRLRSRGSGARNGRPRREWPRSPT